MWTEVTAEHRLVVQTVLMADKHGVNACTVDSSMAVSVDTLSQCLLWFGRLQPCDSGNTTIAEQQATCLYKYTGTTFADRMRCFRLVNA